MTVIYTHNLRLFFEGGGAGWYVVERLFSFTMVKMQFQLIFSSVIFHQITQKIIKRRERERERETEMNWMDCGMVSKMGKTQKTGARKQGIHIMFTFLNKLFHHARFATVVGNKTSEFPEVFRFFGVSTIRGLLLGKFMRWWASDAQVLLCGDVNNVQSGIANLNLEKKIYDQEIYHFRKQKRIITIPKELIIYAQIKCV